MPQSIPGKRLVTRAFIGSSSSSLELARLLKTSLLKYSPEVAATVWDEAFRPGQILIDQIVNLVHEYDFGAFVFAPDDVLLLRGHVGNSPRRRKYGSYGEMSVRDNVLFEAGVFMGGLGHERTFLVVPRGLKTKMRTPSDLEGLLTANYRFRGKEESKLRENANIEDAAKTLSRAIKELGPVPRTAYDELLTLRRTLKECEFRDWKNRLLILGELIKYSAKSRKSPWHQNVDPMEVMRPVLTKWGNSVADTAYWWLVVHGVFRFANIDQFTSEESWDWKDSIEFVTLSFRGAAVLNLFQVTQ